MIPFRFPFRWGAPGASTTTVVATPLWRKLSPDAVSWHAQASALEPRFERIYPEGDTGPQFVRITHVVS